MKQLSILLFSMFTMFNGFAQINIVKRAPKAKVVDAKPFDVTKNYLGEDVDQYIGQELFVRPLSPELQEHGYLDFFSSPDPDSYVEGNTYKQVSDNSSFSIYDSLAGRYFTVIDVVRSSGEDVFLKLKSKKNGEIAYFKYNTYYDFSFPFYVVSYFENIKKKYVGKEYFLEKGVWDNLTDITTGNPVTNYASGMEWKVVDIAISDEDLLDDKQLILTNSKGERVMISYYYVGEYGYGLVEVKQALTKKAAVAKDAARYKEKFGAANWALISKGKVEIGMTKEMCQVAWGKPNDINRTTVPGTVSEQWVYGSGNYLYFKDGILTAIQN